MFGKVLISRELDNGEFFRAVIPNVVRVDVGIDTCIYINDGAHLILLKKASKPYIAKFAPNSWEIRLKK